MEIYVVPTCIHIDTCAHTTLKYSVTSLLIHSLKQWHQQIPNGGIEKMEEEEENHSLFLSQHTQSVLVNDMLWIHTHTHTQPHERTSQRWDTAALSSSECKRNEANSAVSVPRHASVSPYGRLCLCVRVCETSANKIVYKLLCSRKPNKPRFVDRVTRSQSIWTLFRAAPM